MTLDIEPVLDQKNLKPSLTVMGVGGAGSNAVNNIYIIIYFNLTEEN